MRALGREPVGLVKLRRGAFSRPRSPRRCSPRRRSRRTARATSGSGSTTRRSSLRDRVPTVATFKQLHVQDVRLNLYWGGRNGVANARPITREPGRPAYDWSLYDRIVKQVAAAGITSSSRSTARRRGRTGGRGRTSRPTTRPTCATSLYAAAPLRRQVRPSDGATLPRCSDWLAWNEPNNPVFLSPQYRAGGATG